MRLYVIVFAGVCRQLGFGLSCECFVTTESSQIIAFLAYLPLTFPLKVDPLSPTPVSRLSHIIIDRFYYYITLFCALEQTYCGLVYWQRYLVVTWLVPRETVAVSAQVLCTSYSQAPLYSVTSFKYT